MIQIRKKINCKNIASRVEKVYLEFAFRIGSKKGFGAEYNLPTYLTHTELALET